jgi:hypothetical protein
MRPVSASTAVCTLYDGLRPLAEAHRAGVGLSFNPTGNGHWDVALTELVNGRSVLLATIPLDGWISL